MINERPSRIESLFIALGQKEKHSNSLCLQMLNKDVEGPTDGEMNGLMG